MTGGRIGPITAGQWRRQQSTFVALSALDFGRTGSERANTKGAGTEHQPSRAGVAREGRILPAGLGPERGFMQWRHECRHNPRISPMTLSDTQLMLLSSASRREDLLVTLPAPPKTGAARTSL